ncbi:MAG: hypothetical protein HC837_05675 [Chloroflexaceae bacterium]|nr:hypothetical protein [Chloroflexaceae bacterium]
MIELQSYQTLQQEITERIREDRGLLEQIRAEIRPLKSGVRSIQPRTSTSISLVATDGGNNKLQFDPFLVQLIRVVDSSNNEYCLEAITPTTNITQLSEKQWAADGTPRTALGKMMAYLGVRHLAHLSQMIRTTNNTDTISASWVQSYREMVEWATLFSLIREKDFGSDTLIVFDGLLRSKQFADGLFARYLDGLNEGIERHRKQRRKVYLVGIAKHSQALTRYRLAMALEHILVTNYPAYVDIPLDIEKKAYIDTKWPFGNEQTGPFLGGKMFFVKFGSGPRDPIWPVDIYLPQVADAQIVLGYLLADAINGFPVPFYPQCLQQAHEHAALIDFDLDMLQDHIFEGIRDTLGHEAPVLDTFRLQDADPSRQRY